MLFLNSAVAKTRAKINKIYIGGIGGGFAAILLLGLLAACGGGGDDSSANVSTTVAAPTTIPAAAGGDATSNTVASADGNTDSLATGNPDDTSVIDSEVTLPPRDVVAPPEDLVPPDAETPGGLNQFGESLTQIIDAVREEEADGIAPTPADISVIVVEGEIIEGETRYEVALGESIVIEVSSSQFNHEVHIHGYDLTALAGPISPARFEFVADLAGTWEVEFEATSELIFELAVR